MANQEKPWPVEPARNFSFVIDPRCLDEWPQLNLVELGVFFELLQIRENPPSFLFLLPKETTKRYSLFELEVGQDKFSFEDIDLSEYNEFLESDFFGNNEDRDKFIGALSEIDLSLLFLSNKFHADALITSEAAFFEYSGYLYDVKRVRLVEPPELASLINKIAVGNSIFMSVGGQSPKYTFNTYYLFDDKYCYKLINWFTSFKFKGNTGLEETVRSAIYNRYPFILYSRDMFDYYVIQQDHYFRRGTQESNGMFVGYYLSSFYLFLSGMLDHLAVIANLACQLGLKDFQCGIKNYDMRSKLQEKMPRSYEALNSQEISNWITKISYMRNHAAHKKIRLPQRVLVHTDESLKSDDEIWEIITKETDILKNVSDEAVINALKLLKIPHWREDHMRVVAPRIETRDVNGEIKKFRDPTYEMDNDLEMLEKIMNIFLVEMFDFNPES